MLYRERAFHNYFITCHRKWSDQHNQCDIHAPHDGKVGCNTFAHTTAFLYSDWLYFLWRGINVFHSLVFSSLTHSTTQCQEMHAASKLVDLVFETVYIFGHISIV